MECLFEYNDIFFFKVQQKLFYFLTVSDDNSEKNVFINKDFYDEIIKKNYLEIKEPQVNTYCDVFDSKNGSSGYNSYGKGIEDKPDKNSIYMYDRKNELQNNNYRSVDYHSKYNNVNDNSFFGKKLNECNNYNSSYESDQKIPLNKIHNNEIPYKKPPEDYYNSRNEKSEDQKQLSYKLFKEGPVNNKDYRNNRFYFNNYHQDDPLFINRKDYDERYNSNNNYGNPRYNTNDTNNDRHIMIPKISDYDSNSRNLHYNETIRPRFPSDNYYTNPNNSSDNNRKNSISFISGNNNFNPNLDNNYNKNQDPSYIKKNDYRELSRDEYGIKKDFPNDNIDPINQHKPSNDNYYKDQKIHLPRIHEYMDDNYGNNNINPGDRISPNSGQYDDRRNRNYNERFDPVRNYPPNEYRENQYDNRYSSMSNSNDRHYNSQFDEYKNYNNRNSNNFNNDEYDKYSYPNENYNRNQSGRNSINNLLNNNSNQVAPLNDNYSYRPYSQDSNENGFRGPSNIKDLLRNDDGYNEKRPYPPDDRMKKRSLDFIDDEERSRKRQMPNNPSINDITGREYPMDNRNSINERRDKDYYVENRGPINDRRGRPPFPERMNPMNEMKNRLMESNNMGHYGNDTRNRYENNYMGYHNMEGYGRDNNNSNDPHYYSSLNSYERSSYSENRRNSQGEYNQFNNNYQSFNNRDNWPYHTGNNDSNNNRPVSKIEPIDNKNSSAPPSAKPPTFHKKSDPSVVSTPQFPVNAIDMLEDDNDSKYSFYPTIKYKFKNFKTTDDEKERLFDINFDSLVQRNTFEDRKNFQMVMKFITPIIIDRFYDINDIVINKYLLNQYINFEILEYFFHNLNKYFTNNITNNNPIFLMVLLENEDYLNFLPDKLCNHCIQSIIKFSRRRIKLSKTDIYRYYLYKNQIKLIIKQCGIIRDLMINILNAAYIKHDVEQIKKIYSYPEIINTFKLLKACISNDTTQISSIIHETSSALFYKTVQGYTPLHLAINNDNFEVVRILLRCDKVNVNVYDKYGFSPIFYAILKKRYDILKMLIYHPSIKINCKNITGLNPLLFTVVLNNKEALKILLNHHDIDINVTGKHNNTALINLLSNNRNFIEDYQRMIYHFFSLEGTNNINYNDLSNMKILNGNKNNDEYNTKRFILNKINNISEIPLQQNELMNIIISHPRIDLSIKNNYYNNALFYAAKNFNIEIVNKILKKSDTFNVNEKLFNGKTVLHKTIKKKSEKVIKGVRKTSCTEVMNINNIILKKESNDTMSSYETHFKHPENSGNDNNNKLRPILPSPSSSSNTQNSSLNSNMNTVQSNSNINYYSNNNSNINIGNNNDNKSLDNYNSSYLYPNNNNNNNSPNHYMYEQERSRGYYPSSINDYNDNESISIRELYNRMTSDLHNNFINHHENVEGCQFCKSYLYYLNNILDEYERLIQLSAEDIVRYEIIKLFLNNSSVDINVQDDKGITPIMKAVMCKRFDILILIFRMRLLKVDLSLVNYQNETSIDIAKRLGYHDFIQLQLIHRIYLQHVYQ